MTYLQYLYQWRARKAIQDSLSEPNDFTLDEALQGYWDFENNLNDESGKGNNLSGTPTGYNSSIKMHGTYSLQSAGTAMSRTDANLSASFPGKNGTTCSTVTVGGWFYIGNTSSAQNIMYKCVNQNVYTNAWVLRISGSKLVGEIYNSTTYATITGSTTLQNNTWYWFCLTYDGAHINLYLGINDSNNPSTDASPVALTGNLRTGDQPLYISEHSGYSDEIFVFSKVLTSAEMNNVKLHGIKGDR